MLLFIAHLSLHLQRAMVHVFNLAHLQYVVFFILTTVHREREPMEVADAIGMKSCGVWYRGGSAKDMSKSIASVGT